MKTYVSTGAYFASDGNHFQSGKKQQYYTIDGQKDKSKSSNLFVDNRIADAQEAAKNCLVYAITLTHQ